MTHERYPAPDATRIFSIENKYGLWTEISEMYGLQAIAGSDRTDEEKQYLSDSLASTTPPSPEMVAEFEEEHGHDVVAFLDAYTTKARADVRQYIHVGLTSSDLVDYGLFRMLGEHARFMARRVEDLRLALGISGTENIRPGRTHGQIAGHTTWEHQVAAMYYPMAEIKASLIDFADDGPCVKYAGPTGWPGAFPSIHERGRRVADILDVEYVEATQIVHRDRLLGWAALYLRLACALENLAQLVRAGARAEIAEVGEVARRTGSSSLPHKQNPIGCEKVCGLARIARGHFSALAENVATWDDRDISNSSVERIAVPGLASTVEHMILVMTSVMRDLVVDGEMMYGHASDPRCDTNIYQVAVQMSCHLGPIQAAALVREAISRYPLSPVAWRADVARVLAERGFDVEGFVKITGEELSSRFAQAEPPASGSA